MSRIFNFLKSALKFCIVIFTLTSMQKGVATSFEPFKHLDRTLVIVDVGCRWGFAENFTHDLNKFTLYGFGPDENECNRLNNLYEKSNIHFIPKALGDDHRITSLYMTQNPACSSIFPPNSTLTDTHPGLECAKTVGIGEVEMTTLDRWAASANVPVIDHIKLDTQGSEFLVLKGAENALKGIRTIEVEVEFNPIYEGQPLFGEVDKFLRDRDFVLWKFDNLSYYGLPGESEMIIENDIIHYNHRSEKTVKYGGQVHWANAHYVHKDLAQALVTSPMQLSRDIALLDILGHTDISSRLKGKFSTYNGQFLQDGFVYENFFPNKRHGVFVDIGANEPRECSNTYFFESVMGWSGVCVEPHPKLFPKLKKMRNCQCINAAVTPYHEGVLEFLQLNKLHGLSGLVDSYDIKGKQQVDQKVHQFNDSKKIISVKAIPINDLLESQELFHIDFMSLDIEGGELEILKAIDFDRFYIEVISVENNWEDPWYMEAKNSTIRKYMESAGYEYITRLGVDEVYKKKVISV